LAPGEVVGIAGRHYVLAVSVRLLSFYACADLCSLRFIPVTPITVLQFFTLVCPLCVCLGKRLAHPGVFLEQGTTPTTKGVGGVPRRCPCAATWDKPGPATRPRPVRSVLQPHRPPDFLLEMARCWTCAGHPRGREGRGEGDFYPMQRPAPFQRPPSGSRCPPAGAQRATGPLGGPAAGGPNDGVNGDTGMVVGRTFFHPAFTAAGNTQW